MSFETAIIITTYNKPESLELVLMSLLQQTTLPDEIIIADDGSGKETADLIWHFQSQFPRGMKHVWQEDKGFRAARCRNLSMAVSQSDYFIMIDGDMVMHPNFVESHINFAEEGYFVQGSRVMLSTELTQKAYEEKRIAFDTWDTGMGNRLNSIESDFLSSVFAKGKDGYKGIRTCNFACWRDDAFSINGFNEHFEGWGREDSEFAVRLLNNGVKRKNLKFGGIAYHLHHQEDNKNAQDALSRNDEILQYSIDHKLTRCDNGLSNHI